MAITLDFKDTIQARALRDPDFSIGLLAESIECMLNGDVTTRKALLGDYINATIGFEKLATITYKSPKSLMKMISSEENPTANNLFGILHTLQKREGVQLKINPYC